MYHCFVRHHEGHGKNVHYGPPGYCPPPDFKSNIEKLPAEEEPPTTNTDPEKQEPQGPPGGWGGPASKNNGWNRKGRGATHTLKEGETLPENVKPTYYTGSFAVLGKKKRSQQKAEKEESDNSFELNSDNNDQEDEAQEAAINNDEEIERDAGAAPILERGPLQGLPNNFTKADFQDKRNSNSIEEALRNLALYGTDVTELNLEKKLKVRTPFKKACLICCNHYTKPAYKLGVGPINDSCTVAENHKKRGYENFYLVNPTPERFLDLLAFFLHNTKEALTVFFTGHGAQVKDRNGDEDDGFDEAMVFDSGHIIDDDLLVLVEDSCPKNLRLFLLTDCCHSGSIWDLQSEKDPKKLPPNVLSVSAAKDSQTAKQTHMNQKDQGIFTYYFWKVLNAKPQITPKQLEALINKPMQKFNQHYTYFPSRPELADKPFFS